MIKQLKPMAFISRHVPTFEQMALAVEKGGKLIWIGDADAFTVTRDFIFAAGKQLSLEFETVVVVHPAAAMRLCRTFLIGVFENANRAPHGEPPRFFAKSFHVYDVRD